MYNHSVCVGPESGFLLYDFRTSDLHTDNRWRLAVFTKVTAWWCFLLTLFTSSRGFSLIVFHVVTTLNTAYTL